MRVIWDSEEYDALWDKLYREYGFEPDHLGMAELFHCAKQFTVFHLPEDVWDEAQEKALIYSPIIAQPGKFMYNDDCFPLILAQ